MKDDIMNEDTTTDNFNVQIKDGFVLAVLDETHKLCPTQHEFFTHLALIYEVAREICGVTNEAEFRAQLTEVRDEIINFMQARADEQKGDDDA